MTANVMVIVERQFDYPGEWSSGPGRSRRDLAQWRGSPGWHVETETVEGELRLGGRHHHVKVRDNDPSTRVTHRRGLHRVLRPRRLRQPRADHRRPRHRPRRPARAARRVHQDSAATARWCGSSRAPTNPTSPAGTARAGRRSSPGSRPSSSEAEPTGRARRLDEVSTEQRSSLQHTDDRAAEAADEHAADPADEPRVLRHPVQLRHAADRGEPDLRVPRRRPRRPADPQPGRADHRSADPAADRRPLRPDLEPAVGSAQAVLPHRRDRLQHLPVPVPVRHGGLDGRAAAVAARRQQQHGDGALPRVHRRQAAAVAARQGLPRPDLLHRPRHHAGQHLAVRLPAADQRRDRGRHPVLGGRLVHARLGLLDRHRAGLGPHHARRSRRAPRSSPRCAPRRAASARR